MAIEQKVVIRVEIDPDMTKAAAVNAFLSALDKRLDKTNKKLNKTSDLLKDGVAFHLGRAARKMADFGKAILKVNFKGLIVELGLVTIGLVAMKGALAAGRGIMRGWDSTVSFLKVTTAGFTASIVALVSALTAANRQFQQTQLSPFIGGMQNAREAMGALRSESLAPMGVQNLSATAAMLSRAGLDTRKQAAVMREIANISSGDPKAFQAMSQAVVAVQSSGKTQAGVEALRGLGPMFKDVAGKAGSMSADEFIKAMGSGKLTPEAFQGQMGRLNETLMGGFKGMVTKFYVALADMGLVFLNPLRNALAQVEHIFLRTIYRVTGMIHEFGLETLIPKLVSGMERFTNWWVKLIANDLPRLLKVYGDIADWWRNFTAGTSDFFSAWGESWDRFAESGEAAWEFWKNIFREIGDFMGGRFNEYDADINKNRKEFEMFGTSLGRVIAGILGVVTAFKDEFMNMLPELNDFFSFLTLSVFPVMQDFAENFAKAFKSALPVIRNIVSAFLPLLRVMNSLIGALSEAGMGMGVLFAGWLAMTQGGRGMMSWTRAGYMGAAAPVAGQAGQASWLMGRAMGGGPAAAQARAANAATMAAGGTGTGFFATRAAARGNLAAANPWKGGGMKGAANSFKGRYGGFGLSKGMGMPMMIGGLIASQVIGGMMGGEHGEAVATAGSMAAMGSMFGLGGAAIGGAIGLGLTANKARTSGGGALSGAAAGGLAGAAIGSILPGVGTLAGLIGGTIIGGISGYLRGRRNAENMAKLGEEFVETLIDNFSEAIDKATSREKITNITEELDELLGDDAKLRDMAKQEGLSVTDLTARLYGAKGTLAGKAEEAFRGMTESVVKLSSVTGESALLIEENAERWGIALQAGGQAVDDYIAQRNSGFKHTTAAEIEGLMLGATYDTLFNSPMHLENNVNKAGLEAKAATNALFTNMQNTGDIDMDLLDAYVRTGIAELAASGMSVPDQMAAMGRVFANMGTNATRMGYGGMIQDPIRQLQSNYGVTPGGTGKGFVDLTFDEFKKTNFYAQGLTERRSSLFTEGTEAEQAASLESKIREMYGASDGAEQMQIFNQTLWSKDADALIAHKNEVNLDTEALEKFREELEKGLGFTPPPGDPTMGPSASGPLGPDPHQTERFSEEEDGGTDWYKKWDWGYFDWLRSLG